MYCLKKNKAQSTAEYVIILGLVVGAVVAMQTYVKRGLQGRVREVTDVVDNGQGIQGTREVVSFVPGTQYEPYYVNSRAETTRTSQDQETLDASGSVNKAALADEVSTRKAGSYSRTLADEARD